MKSPAFITFSKLMGRADTLIEAANYYAVESSKRSELYASAILSSCAAWQAYIEQLLRTFFDETSSFRTANATPFHQIAFDAAEGELKRFNTPNSDNVRNLLMKWASFDPWPYWRWPDEQLDVMSSRQRLDSIVKIRHSVAHGFQMPRIDWSNPQENSPTEIVTKRAQSFLAHLASETDTGMAEHLEETFGVTVNW